MRTRLKVKISFLIILIAALAVAFGMCLGYYSALLFLLLTLLPIGFILGAVFAEYREKTQQQLAQFSKMSAIGQLASGVAHELNNPLTGVLNNIQMMKMIMEGKTELNAEEFKEIVNIIEESALRCKNVISSLLYISHAAKGKFEPLKIDSVVDKVLAIVTTELKLDNIPISQELNGNASLVKGDPQLLGQVILNLLANAKWAIKKKFASEEGGEITIKTWHSPQEKKVYFSVSDNGVGIDEKNIPRIFEPFYTTKDAGEGTGLGLAVLYNIIQTHNGAITVQSRINSGTTFKVSLPCV